MLINHKKGIVHRNREKALADAKVAGDPPSEPFKPSPFPFSSSSQPSNSGFNNNFPNTTGNFDKGANAAPKAPTADDIEAAIEKFKVKYIEVDDKKTGQKKQKLVVPDDWEFCKPCGAHLRTQQVQSYLLTTVALLRIIV